LIVDFFDNKYNNCIISKIPFWERRKEMKKLLVLLLVVGLAVTIFAGCKTAPPPVEKIKVGLCTDVGGRGDKSFNDSALRGLENWAAGVKMIAGTGYQALTTDEFNKIITDEAPDLADRGIKSFAVEPVVLESKANEDYVPNLKKLADEGCKLVIGVGFMLTDAIAEVAPQYPNTYFMLIDGVIDPAPANVVCYVFKEQEGSCLVGALAGQMTKTNKVGFVGGMELSLIKKFEAGYKAGVKIVNPNVEVFSGYTGNFTNADDGQKIAKTQFDKGADIVYHASGACGIGVIKEAQTRGTGYYAIGVDSDQDYLAPGRVLTSMIKHVDYACWLATKSVIEKTFTSGIVALGIKEGGVGMSPLKYTKDIIPAAAVAKVEKIRQMIASGELVVPDTLEAFATFVPPTIP
jgi:basic membrane protein A